MAHCAWCPAGSWTCLFNGAPYCRDRPYTAAPSVSRRVVAGTRYCWTELTFPGYEAEWIEYTPSPRIVERDGDLWWEQYDQDTLHWTQITKGRG